MERFHRASQHHSTELFVNAMNRRRLPYWLTTNHMADWTREERKKRDRPFAHPEGHRRAGHPQPRGEEQGGRPAHGDRLARQGSRDAPEGPGTTTHPDRNEEQCIKERMNE